MLDFASDVAAVRPASFCSMLNDIEGARHDFFGCSCHHLCSLAVLAFLSAILSAHLWIFVLPRDRPDGTAFVIFANHEDAAQAIKRYNNVALDGKPMKIELAKPGTGGSTRLSSGLR